MGEKIPRMHRLPVGNVLRGSSAAPRMGRQGAFHIGIIDPLLAGNSDRPSQSAPVKLVPEIQRLAEGGISQKTAECHAGCKDAVKLLNPDGKFGPMPMILLGHTGLLHSLHVVRPRLRQIQAQPKRNRVAIAGQCRRDKRLAVGGLAGGTRPLGSHTNGVLPRFQQGGVVKNQDAPRPASKVIPLPHNLIQEKAIIKFSLADEMMQTVIGIVID